MFWIYLHYMSMDVLKMVTIVFQEEFQLLAEYRMVHHGHSPRAMWPDQRVWHGATRFLQVLSGCSLIQVCRCAVLCFFFQHYTHITIYKYNTFLCCWWHRLWYTLSWPVGRFHPKGGDEVWLICMNLRAQLSTYLNDLCNGCPHVTGDLRAV